MKISSFFLISIIFLLSLNCHAQEADSIIHKFIHTEFIVSYDKKDIPKLFLNYYDKLQLKSYGKRHMKKFTITNPNMAFNPTDLANDLPDRRLICNGKDKNDDLYFIYFEKGGAVDQRYLYVIGYLDDRVKSFTSLSIEDTIKTYDGLKRAIIDRKFHVMR